MKKFLLSFFCMLGIMSYAYADEAKFDFTTPSGLTPSITDDKFSDAGNDAFAFNTAETTFTSNGVTLNTTDGSTASRIWKAASGKYDFRVYKTATMTIAAPEGGVITAIAFDGSTVNSFSANSGTVDGKNWTGAVTSVVFTWASDAKTQKINTVTVTFSTDGSVTPDPEEPEGGEGEGGETPEEPETPSSDYLNETFATDLGSFTTQETVGSYPWVFAANYGAKASGYADGSSQNAESWLISPAMDLTGETKASIAFDYVINKGDANAAATNHKLLITSNYTGDVTTTEWTEVEYGAVNNGNWTFNNTGNIALPESMMDKPAVVIAFKYVSTTENSSTWEIKNVVVSGEKGATVEPEEPEGGEDEELEVTDISDIIDAGAGKAKAQGTIVATYARGFLLDDGTGSILVYLGSDGGNAVGEIVTVEGTTSMYGGLLQFAAGSVVTRLTTTTVSYPAATAMDGAAMDAYLAAPAIQYVEYTGTLTISDKGYYNVAVDGATTAIGSIQYPQDAIKASLTSGAVVKVTGYTIGVSSSKYVNTMAVMVEVIEEGEEPEEPETPTETKAYTVTEALDAYVDGQQIPAIVTGYIVGAVNNAPEKDSQFGTDATIATNILISDNPDTNDYTECLIVQLPSGAIRTALNLVDNPGNYKKQVKITGSVEKYFKVAGMKSVTAYEFTGVTGIEKVEIRNEKSEIYDLTGRRVETITEPGIYIVNGVKKLVR